jgi:hypothetical protein
MILRWSAQQRPCFSSLSLPTSAYLVAVPFSSCSGTSGVVRRGLLRQPDGSWGPVAVKLLNSPPGEQATEAYNRHLRTLVQVGNP